MLKPCAHMLGNWRNKESRGEPWGRKRCRLKAGGRFAPACPKHRPAMRVVDVQKGAPKWDVGHLLGGSNPSQLCISLSKTRLFRGHLSGGSRIFSKGGQP